MKRCLLICCLMFSGVTLTARAQQDLTREQVAAYVALTKADRARERGETNAALAAYEEALGKYAAIKKQDPRWHPDVVQYRLAYCANELEKLKRPAAPVPAPEKPAEKPTAQPAPDSEAPALRARVEELETMLTATQAWIKAISEQLANERIAVAEQVGLSLKSASTATAERDQAQTQLKTLEQDMIALKTGYARATGDVAALTARLAETSAKSEETLARASEENRKEIEKLKATAREKQQASEQALADARRELETLKAAAAKQDALRLELESQLQALRKSTAALDEARAQATGDVAALKASLTETIAKNEEEKKSALETAKQEREKFKAEAAQELKSVQDALAASQKEVEALKSSKVSPRQIEHLTELAETRLQALKSAEVAKAEVEAQLTELRQTLTSTQKALESALADKLELEVRESATRSEVSSLPPDDRVTRLEAQNKALRETLDYQEKDMTRVREFKKKIAELEKELRDVKAAR